MFNEFSGKSLIQMPSLVQKNSSEYDLPMIKMKFAGESIINLDGYGMLHSDPLVKVMKGHQLVFQTSYIYKSKNPVWNEEWTCWYDESNMNDTLKFIVEDDDSPMQNDIVGECNPTYKQILDSALNSKPLKLELKLPNQAPNA